MAPSVDSIVSRYLRASALPDPGDDVSTLSVHVTLLNRLITKGESRRLGRSDGILVRNVRYSSGRVQAEVKGSSEHYQTRITFTPPGHHCTCVDWAKNGARVGPCKHVLRLAELWLDVLVEKLERL